MVQRAEAAGFRAIALTVDATAPLWREGEKRTPVDIPPGMRSVNTHDRAVKISPTLTWKTLDQIRSWTKMKIVLKGVVTGEDTKIAVENGVDGVICSNHGGRALDWAITTMDALPEVVEAADGRIEVYMDGGVRRGIGRDEGDGAGRTRGAHRPTRPLGDRDRRRRRARPDDEPHPGRVHVGHGALRGTDGRPDHARHGCPAPGRRGVTGAVATARPPYLDKDQLARLFSVEEFEPLAAERIGAERLRVHPRLVGLRLDGAEQRRGVQAARVQAARAP